MGSSSPGSPERADLSRHSLDVSPLAERWNAAATASGAWQVPPAPRPSFCSARHPTRPLFPLLPSLSCSDAGRGNSVCRTACHVARRSRRLFLLSSPHKRLFCFPPKIARLASPLLPPSPPLGEFCSLASGRKPTRSSAHSSPPPCWLSPATDDQKAKPNGENDGRGGSCRSHKQADVLDLHQFVGGEAVGSRKHILAVESRVFRCPRFMQISLSFKIIIL